MTVPGATSSVSSRRRMWIDMVFHMSVSSNRSLTSRSCRRSVALGIAIALVGVSLASATVAAAPASAIGSATATDAARALTARIVSVNHGLQRVTLAGTGPVGGSIAVSGAGVEPVWTEAGPDGRWSVPVHVTKGQSTVVVRSEVSGDEVRIPVSIDNTLLQPTGRMEVDDVRRTMTVEIKPAKPGARWDFTVDGVQRGSAVVPEDGIVTYTYEQLGFGGHLFIAEQFYDGEQNGRWFGEESVDGTVSVTSAAASRQTGGVTVEGIASVGTRVRLADPDGPVVGPDGAPLVLEPDTDGRWRATFPVGDRSGLVPLTVDALDDHGVVATTTTGVDVPEALTAAVEQLPDGGLRLVGSGAPGAVVSLEDDRGRPVRDGEGRPVTATVPAARGVERAAGTWQIAVAREFLPPEAVVVRQRLDDVEQGSLRLVLPALPVRPLPAGDPDVSAGNHPAAAHATGSRIAERATTRLASTGTDPSGPLGAAALLLAAGAAVLLGQRSRDRSRRRLHRGGR